jgi:3-oxoacyl-(acyl-carrier-protein) synthase/acyl carrier protein
MKLSQLKTFSEENRDMKPDENGSIAIIGMDCTIGPEETIYGFWESLKNQTDFISYPDRKREKMTRDILRLLGEESDDAVVVQPMCFLRNLDTFDYTFFGMNAQEAILTDPSQRLLLESAYRCFEDANQVPRQYNGKNIGVFIGYDDSDLIRYKDILYHSDPDLYGLSIPGNHPAIQAGRIADYFDLKGPAYVINTACSSSLSALHQACKAIRSGECNMALVSTINFSLTPVKQGSFMLGIEAAQDRTKTFSDQADGTGKGEGLVSLLLKPYHRAVDDTDAIYAIIQGCAAGQDGKSSSLTSPNMLAQAQVLQKAWKDAGIDPRKLQYIEAHGTGTKIGDPIEIDAIKKAMEPFTNDKMFCAVGSIKSNIGHLNAAAGLVGVLKTALILKHRELVPNCHFEYPNPYIDFLNSPVYVCNKRVTLTSDMVYAGVSSFGLSGTNVHVVMSSSNIIGKVESPSEPFYKILAVSAKTPSALKNLVDEYLWHMEGLDEQRLFSYCYTVNTRRVHYTYRRVFWGRTVTEIREQMTAYLYGEKLEASFYPEIKTSSETYSNHIQGILANNSERDCSLLRVLCAQYIAGEDINWNECYSPYVFQTMHVPTYRFDNLPCFWNTVKEAAHSQSQSEKTVFYTLSWSTLLFTELSQRRLAETVVVVYTRDRFSQEIQESVSAYLEGEKHRVVCVLLEDLMKPKMLTAGDQFDWIFDEQILLQSIERTPEISLLYLASLHDAEGLPSPQESLERGVFGVFYIYRFLISLKIKIADFVCVGNDGGAVESGEFVNPYNGALYEFVNGLQADQASNPHVFRNIDIVRNTDTILLHHLLECDTESIIGLRKSQLYKRIMIPVGAEQKSPLTKDGVYLVSGGTSENALCVCRAISEKYQGVFYLLSRHLEPYKENPRLKQMISDIESNGGIVHKVCCDVSSEDSVSSTINALCLDTRNHISGVIHAAGVESRGMVCHKTSDSILATIAPKVLGMLNLYWYTRSCHPDFFLSFSSLSALLPSLGQADYAYANRFLDLYSQSIQGDCPRALSVNWPAFQEAGMAVRNWVDFDLMEPPPLSFQQLAATFLDVLAHGSGHLYPCARSLTRQEREAVLAGEHLGSAGNKADDSIRFKNMTEAQNTIANIWRKYLGHDNIGIDDDFTALGGNSLNMIYVVSAIEKAFHVSLGEDLMVELPTIREIAKQLDGAAPPQSILLEMVEPFNNFFFVNCYFNALFSVLCYYKYPVSHLILACPIQFLCDRNSFTLEYTCLEPWQDMLKDISLKLIVRSEKINLQLEILENLSEKRRPVILSIDCFYLSYRHDMYQKQHFVHSLLVYGYDGNASLFHIIDQVNAESLSYQKFTISVCELQQAYEGYLEHFPAEKTPPFSVVYPTEEGNQHCPRDIEGTCVEDAATFVKQICQRVQWLVRQEHTANDTFLKMLNQCVQYFNTQIYVNNEVYKDRNYGIFLTGLLQLFKQTRASFIREIARGGDSRRILRNLENLKINE